MLVLSRKPDQEIQIGPNISIRVIQIGKDRVQIGITAPKEIAIRRKELDPQCEQAKPMTWCEAMESLSPINNTSTKAVC